MKHRTNASCLWSLKPKLGLTDEQPENLQDSIPLDHSEPEPAPGIRLKIPN